MVTKITAKEYAKFREVYPSHVRRYCKAITSGEQKKLVGVKHVERFGNTYILTMEKDYQELISATEKSLKGNYKKSKL